jgi:BCCT family betaine/carnitine transporter
MKERSAAIDHHIFWPALVCVLAIVVPIIAAPEASDRVLKDMLNFTTHQLGFLYLWFTVAVFVTLAWFAFGRYGGVKLGDAEDQPEFSGPSWVAMLFCAGVGTSLLYWATIEWVYYYQAPPFGIESESAKAAHWAAMYGLFHWGPSAWALYCIPALPIAYSFHVRKIPFLRMSEACRGLLGDRVDGLLGKLIDILFILGLVGGTGTSLGLGTPILSEAISSLLNIERSLGLDVVVVAIWTVLFSTSVYLGLEKGIKWLSDINVFLGLGLCACILVLGPTVFILDTFTNSIGLLASYFVQMSFYTDPVGKSGFPQSWTIFYWAWWIAYAPYMGLFIARISKGRTIRQVVVANLVWGSLGCWLFFALLGNTALNYELNGVVPVMQIMADVSPQAAIVAVIEALPFGTFMLVIFLLMGFIYSATTVDSSAYSIASVASKDLKAGEREPRRWNRVFWALTLGTMAVALMYLGGLEPLKTVSLVVAFPLMIIIAISVGSLLRWLKEDEA